MKITCSGWPTHGTLPRDPQSWAPDRATRLLFGPDAELNVVVGATHGEGMSTRELSMSSRWNPCM